MQPDIAKLQEIIGYRFKDEKLLIAALTHPSYAYESREADVKDYNRLEFLGDSILGFAAAEHLYLRHPTANEGELTRLRSLAVNRDTLAKKARELDLSPYLYLGKGEEKTGGRRNATNLSSAFEAIIGAIYLDGGIEAAKDFIIARVMA